MEEGLNASDFLEERKRAKDNENMDIDILDAKPQEKRMKREHNSSNSSNEIGDDLLLQREQYAQWIRRGKPTNPVGILGGKIDFHRVPKDSPFPYNTFRNYKKHENTHGFTLGEFVSFSQEVQGEEPSLRSHIRYGIIRFFFEDSTSNSNSNAFARITEIIPFADYNGPIEYINHRFQVGMDLTIKATEILEVIRLKK